MRSVIHKSLKFTIYRAISLPFDGIAAKQSQFGKRIAHGYFVLSAAAGLFVSPGVGPVLANYGLDNLRFVNPVGIGDTIRARLTCKRKVDRNARMFSGSVRAWWRGMCRSPIRMRNW